MRDIIKLGLLLGTSLVLFNPVAVGDRFPQWRGPNRDGNSQAQGLLREWPKEGPKLLWQVKDLGRGYSTPAVVNDRLYLLGSAGVEQEWVQARSTQDGRTLWTTPVGKVGNPDQKPSYPAARSTPTVDGDRLYALGSDGDLVCLETASGKVVWRKSLRSDFGGKPGIWAYSESPLVDGELVICTPGGKDAAVVALNKTSGETVWKCATAEGDEAAYASPLTMEAAGAKQYVQMLQQGLLGIDAKTGKALWRYAKTVSQYRANIPTPLVRGDLVFSAGAGTGAGLVRIVARDGALAVEQVYLSSKLPTAIGGVVLVGDHLFGTTAQAMLCVEFNTGSVKWEERAFGAASLCHADGRLYLQAESGEVGLVEPSAEAYREVGRFRPPGRPERLNQMEKSWTYPVVCNGRLYLRDHEAAWCYDVSATP